MPRLDPDDTEWGRTQRELHGSGFDPAERGWVVVRQINRLTGRRRVVAKALFLLPVVLVLAVLLVGLMT